MTSRNDRAFWAAAAAIGLAAAIAACSGGESKSRREIRGPAAALGNVGGGQATALKRVDPTTGGTISGTIKWQGGKPAPERIDVSGNPECVKVLKEAIYDESLVVNDNETLRFTYVSIDTNDAYEPPADAALVDQVACRYTPHVFAVMSGQKLKIKSSDQFLHNAHYIPASEANPEKNLAMPAPMTIEKSFVGPDKVKFKCEVHPWMGAWCFVPTHPFFAVSGADGSFTITNVPPGTHKLVARHEKLGEQTATVTVETGKTTTQDFTFSKK